MLFWFCAALSLFQIPFTNPIAIKLARGEYCVRREDFASRRPFLDAKNKGVGLSAEVVLRGRKNALGRILQFAFDGKNRSRRRNKGERPRHPRQDASAIRFREMCYEHHRHTMFIGKIFVSAKQSADLDDAVGVEATTVSGAQTPVQRVHNDKPRLANLAKKLR
jgi:hypothetical protein